MAIWRLDEDAGRKKATLRVKEWLGHLGLEVIIVARWLPWWLPYMIHFPWSPTVQCKGRNMKNWLVNIYERRSLVFTLYCLDLSLRIGSSWRKNACDFMEVIFYRPLKSSLLNCERERSKNTYEVFRVISKGYQEKFLEQGVLTPEGTLFTQ